MASAVFQKFTYRNVACATRFNFKKTMLAGLPLFLGGLIYLLFRPGSLRIFMWLDLAGLREPLELLRVHTLQLVPLMPEWSIYSLPNGLWAFSYAFIITATWWKQPSRLKQIWLLSLPAVGLGYELLQFAGAIPGTFCYQDLLFCTAGIAAGFAAAINLERRLQV